LRVVVRNGARHVVLAIVEVTAIAIGGRKPWVAFDGGVEIGHGAGGIAFTKPGVAVVVMGQRE
jgi:hypothetical protein